MNQIALCVWVCVCVGGCQGLIRRLGATIWWKLCKCSSLGLFFIDSPNRSEECSGLWPSWHRFFHQHSSYACVSRWFHKNVNNGPWEECKLIHLFNHYSTCWQGYNASEGLRCEHNWHGSTLMACICSGEKDNKLRNQWTTHLSIGLVL